jgi:hypothetical protein
VTLVEEEGRFVGYVKEDKKFGRGRFYYNDGMYYDGYWLNNKKHGQGSIYYPDNELCYQGCWKDDLQDGDGEAFNNNYATINGPLDYKDLSNIFQ